MTTPFNLLMLKRTVSAFIVGLAAAGPISPANAQLIGDQSTIYCGSNVHDDMIDSAITIICGISNENFTKAMDLALSTRPENNNELRVLLQSLLPDGSRIQAESLRSFFELLGQDTSSRKPLKDQLAEIATRHLQLEKDLTAFQVGDPEVQAFIDIAAEALATSPPSHEIARVALSDARDRRRTKQEAAQALLDGHLRENARIASKQGDLEAAILNWLKAARFYEEAANILPESDRSTRSSNLSNSAAALEEHFNWRGGWSELEQAIVIRRQILQLRDSLADHKEWVLERIALADTIATLGIHSGSIALLEEAVEIKFLTLEGLKPSYKSLDRARLLTSLGDSYLDLGKLQGNLAHYYVAISIYTDALLKISPEEEPTGWSTIHLKIGNVFLSMGQSLQDPSPLEEAVTVYNIALKTVVSQSFERAGKRPSVVRFNLRDLRTW